MTPEPIRRAIEIAAQLLCVVGLAIFLSVLTAPPLMVAMTRQNPREWPRVYAPLAVGFQCDWTRPVFLWYFDNLWKADTESRGE